MSGYRIVSIFIGGGTPSLLSEAQITSVFSALRESFLIEEDAEVTIEVNPGTVNEGKLACYRKLGINRLSIGLQSVNDEELKYLGRIHNYEQFLDTYHLARQAGFDNINIDLISAIPGQTVESWGKTLKTVAGLSPEHISAYSLIIEEGTKFYELYGGQSSSAKDANEETTAYVCPGEAVNTEVKEAVKPLPDEDAERKMYQMTESLLRSYGFRRYEISNYAKEGFACRHNLGYWERTEYLGIGAGAASLVDHKRWTFGEEPELLDVQHEMEEFMFLGLRRMKGVSKKKFYETFHKEMKEVYAEAIVQLKEKELLEEAGDWIRLTEKGIDVSNYVMSEFLFE